MKVMSNKSRSIRKLVLFKKLPNSLMLTLTIKEEDKTLQIIYKVIQTITIITVKIVNLRERTT